MSLVSCSECGAKCSSKALACPGCGQMIRGRGWWAVTIGWGVIMSAVISFLLTIIVVVAFVVLLGGLGAIGSYVDRPAVRATPTPTPFR